MARVDYNTRAAKLLEQIEETWIHSPSLAELAAWMDAPLSSTWYALEILEREGAVVVRNRRRDVRNGSRLRIVPSGR